MAVLPLAVEIAILAGGRSTRMGRDKARLRLGSLTFLGQIKQTAAQLGLPIRVIRRDLVPACGPLGGVLTALKKSRADAVLFLSCDMPFITAALLRRLLRAAHDRRKAVFVSTLGRVGFPFILPAQTAVLIKKLLKDESYSLQTLAKKLGATTVRVGNSSTELLNINTPGDLTKERRLNSNDHLVAPVGIFSRSAIRVC